MRIQNLDVKSFSFFGLLMLLGLLMYQIISPFLSLLLIALVITELFYPLYTKLQKVVRSRGLASALTTLSAIMILIIPTILIIFLALSEVSNLLSNGELNSRGLEIENTIHSMVASINTLLTSVGVSADNQLQSPDLQVILGSVLNGIRDSLLPLTTGIISFSFNALFYMFIFIITLLYLFTAYSRLPNFMKRISPLDDRFDDMLFQQFVNTIRAIIAGSFIVALAQASAVSLAMIILGIGAPVLLWVIMVVLSLVPVGSGFVWAPAGVILILEGRVVEGIFLIVYSAVIINVIDALLRPIVLKNRISLHPLIILLSVIGGIGAFGPLGIFYGPLIAVFFMSLMEVYNLYYSSDNTDIVVDKSIQ